MQDFGEEATFRDLDNPNMTIFSPAVLCHSTAMPKTPTGAKRHADVVRNAVYVMQIAGTVTV
jgi:hypothetical protein